jgi:hypothetical protein
MVRSSHKIQPHALLRGEGDSARRGLNSNIWFGNVEEIASEGIGGETVAYVSNIYR